MTKLEEARLLILSHWCRGVSARTKFGEPCLSKDPHAVQWCSMGALSKVHDDDEAFNRDMDKLASVAQTLYGCSVLEVNDGLGHEATIKMFEAAS